jgi:hypothetical protein
VILPFEGSIPSFCMKAVSRSLSFSSSSLHNALRMSHREGKDGSGSVRYLARSLALSTRRSLCMRSLSSILYCDTYTTTC